MSRRDEKYGNDEEEESKPVRPHRLRREEEIDRDEQAEHKQSSSRDQQRVPRDREDSKPTSPSRDSPALDEPAPKPRRRREQQSDSGGGWMNKSAGGPRVAHTTPAVDDREMDMDTELPDVSIANQNKHFDMNKDEGEIIMIPDLEDDGGGDGDGRVARAPRNFNRKIPTLAELENDARAAIMMGESGLDLSVLLNTLVPPAMLEEEDSVWTFESLLREITEELLPLLKADEEQGSSMNEFGSAQ